MTLSRISLFALALSPIFAACSGDKADTGGDDGTTDGSDGTTDGSDGTTDGADGTADGSDGATDGTDGASDGASDGTDGTDGTDGSDGADGTDGSDGGATTGRVRLAHFGVFPLDADSTVDIYVNGAPSGVSFAFKQATPYVEIPAGTYDIDIVPGGGTISDSVFTVAGFEVVAGQDLSVFARGYVAPPAADDNGFGVGAFVDNRAGIPSGQVRVNIIHAAPLGALDPVDVWLVDGACAPSGTAPLLDNFAFGATAENIDLPSTAVNVGFDVGGNGTVDACFMIPATIVDEIVNVYAVNDAEGKVSLVAVFPDGSTAELMPVGM